MFNLNNFEQMSRLSIEIEPEQHRQIKTLATYAGLSIKDYILKQTIPSRSLKQDATDELLGSEKIAERLREAITTPASQHLVFNSLDDLKNALGI